ncbi:MAG: hypothetical protein FWG67_08550 [Defluviitaleaceae bacterium]|nr:hypothetical protein [Defluviitaleaceae bacterium]
MIENHAWLGILFVTNVIDYIIMYLMGHNLGGDHKLEKKWRHHIFILLFSGIFSIINYHVGNDALIVRMLAIVISLLVIKIATRRKLFDVFIIHVAIFLTLFTVQSLTGWLFGVWEMNDELTLLVMQFIIFFVFSLLCWKVSLYEFFSMIKQRLILIIGLICLYIIVYALLIMFQFNMNNVFDQVFLFVTLIILILSAFFSVVMMAQKKIDQTSDRYHDLVNKFAGLYLAIEADDEHEKIKALSRELKQYITGRADVIEVSDSYEENFGKVLEEKLVISERSNQLNLDIGYYEHHEIVSLGSVVYMLGSLFDNALEHGLDGPIFVYLNVCKNHFELSVKNACQKMSDRKLDRLFKKGFSTKEQVGCGQGLYKLKREVEAYRDQRFKAQLKADHYYDVEYKLYYLDMTIKILSK